MDKLQRDTMFAGITDREMVEAVAVEPAWSRVEQDALEAGLVGCRDLRVVFPVDRDESRVAQAGQVVSGDGC